MSKGKRPSQLLLDYRAVYNQPAEQDTTAGQFALRKLFLDKPDVFMQRLQSMEVAHTSARAKVLGTPGKSGPKPREPKADAPVVVDSGTEKCLEVAERLLKEWAK